MKQLLPYRIITFILLPIAAVFGLFTLIMLLAALANPAILLGVFLFASMVIYVIASFIFLQKGIDKNQLCNHSLKDWIRVNAFVSIVYCVLMLLNSVTLLGSPKLLNDTIHEMLSQQQNLMPLPEATYIRIIKGVFYFLAIYSAILLVHIILTFRVLKAYKHMFAEKG